MHKLYNTYNTNRIGAEIHIREEKKRKKAILTVKQPMRPFSNGRWNALVSEHHSRSSLAALWNPVVEASCCENQRKIKLK